MTARLSSPVHKDDPLGLRLHFDEDLDNLRKLMKNFPKIQKEFLGVGSLVIERVMKKVMKDKFSENQTGEMIASVVTIMRPGYSLTGPTSDPSEAVDRGSVPHIIAPRRKKALAWRTPFGDDVIAGIVHHPGFRGHHFTEATAQLAPPELIRTLTPWLRGRIEREGVSVS